MKMSDARDIRAPKGAVWAGITDPETLKRCIPGCQEMTGSIDEGFEALVVQKVGPVKASFRGHVTVRDVIEGESCTLSGEGKGGPAGFAKGEARVTLSEIEDGTRLTYEVEAKVGGKLAQLGGRIIDGVAGRMADQFFDCFKEALENDEVAAAEGRAETGGGAATSGVAERGATLGADAAPEPGPAAAPVAPAEAGVSAQPAPAALAAKAAPDAAPDAALDGETLDEAPGTPEKKGWLRRLVSRDGAAG